MAARMLGTPAAVLRLDDPELGPRGAAIGLRAGESPGAVAVEGFAFRASAPIVTADGRQIGELTVLDRRPRRDLAEDEAGTLRDLAMLAADAVEDAPETQADAARAAWILLADRLKALAVEAAGYEAAVEATAEALCAATGGLLCTLHRLGADGATLQLVGGHAAPALGGTELLDGMRAVALAIADTLLGAAIVGGRQRVLEQSGGTGAERHPLLHAAPDFTAMTLVATPVRIADERCVLLLGCPSPGPDLLDLVRDAAATLRPLLQMLRDEERTVLHRRVVEASSEAVLITEATPDEGRIVHVNPAFEALTGFSATELVGRSPRLLQGMGADGADWSAIADALRQKQRMRQEAAFRRKDGSQVWVDLHIAPVTDPSGRCTHLVSMVRDITREHEATQRLAESEAAFRSLFERNPIPMWIYDQETLAFLSVNDAAIEDYGWSREQFLRMTILDIRPEEDRAAARAASAQLRRTRGASGPWRHLTAQGEEKIVEVSLHLTEFAGRRAVLVAALDVTARTRFERDLRLSRAALQRQAVELRQTQRLARLGTWRWQADLQQVSWSEEVHAILGTDPSAPVPAGPAALSLVLPEDRTTVSAALSRIVRTGQPGAFEFRVRRPDGRLVHCRAEGRWESDPAGGPDSVLGYMQDVTAQREAEAALRQADRLNSLGQITGGIAHDFNNLLTVASVSLEMAADEAHEGRTAPDLIEAARGALERGMRLTSQLLSYARRQPLRPQPLDLGALLPGLVELIQRSLGERYPIRLSTAPTPKVSADPAQLEAALLNLLVNARDAMPGGGPIAVETRLVSVRAGEGAPEEELAAGHYAMIAVTDRGSGMPPEIRTRIFEPFFTTKSPGQGTGLGLSMVMGFAKQSGGHVSVASEPGKGTCFTLYLPVVADGVKAEVVVAGAGDAPAAVPPGLEVLVVEDQPDVRKAAVRLCRQIGMQPVAVQGAAEALELLGSGFRFDVLFTDVVLGGEMDGLELAEAATRLQPNLAVICTSGYSEQQFGQRQDGQADLDILRKPYDIRSFRDAVGRALAAAATRPAPLDVE
ncbi:PAS domain S-box protein [Roseomonas sp. AR75]|uniref:PAS domain S-box protein n=1 Tax=Roseomonas sp. AR75 TaxID=2562311 RepID=UPI0010C0A742|nr:PAS domain S-box protein [Roseomonas sp. AR75]